MRKVTLLAAFAAVLPALTAGAALAESFRGTDGPDRIVGTTEGDRIDGLAGDDDLIGRAGSDVIFGNRGDDDIYGGLNRDRIDAGRGDDFIDVQGDDRRDVVRANPMDTLAADCEVSRAAF